MLNFKNYKNYNNYSYNIIKILLTTFVIILVPVYLKNYGIQNFLWLSDIALFLTVLALWFRSSLLLSIAVVGILPVEILWNFDFFTELVTGHSSINLAHYMFLPKYPLYLRALSLFHIFMPLIWIWYLIKFGYNKKAFKYFVILAIILAVITYLFTDPDKNINFIFMPIKYNWKYLSPVIWIIIVITLSLNFITFPMHLLLKRFFSKKL